MVHPTPIHADPPVSQELAFDLHIPTDVLGNILSGNPVPPPQQLSNRYIGRAIARIDEVAHGPMACSSLALEVVAASVANTWSNRPRWLATL